MTVVSLVFRRPVAWSCFSKAFGDELAIRVEINDPYQVDGCVLFDNIEESADGVLAGQGAGSSTESECGNAPSLMGLSEKADPACLLGEEQCGRLAVTYPPVLPVLIGEIEVPVAEEPVLEDQISELVNHGVVGIGLELVIIGDVGENRLHIPVVEGPEIPMDWRLLP